jgi:agmatinase
MTEPVPRTIAGDTVGPVDATVVPRYAGEATFARLPRIDEVGQADVAILGVPFDSGISYRPGARFGPSHIRESSRLLRPYNPALKVPVFAGQQVADAGDLTVNPFSIDDAIAAIERGARSLLERTRFVLTLGGDHTVALPMLRAVSAVHGPVAVVHFDAHLDTWDTYFGAAYTHGTAFRRAAEEGLLDRTGCLHVGIRGPLYTQADLDQDSELGFRVIAAPDLDEFGVSGVAERIRHRVGDRPMYVSVDIDVLDPAHAPGTGTPEAGGLSNRELLATLRSFAQLNLVGADIVEVAPAYDHAQITGIAAAHVGYELLSALAARKALFILCGVRWPPGIPDPSGAAVMAWMPRPGSSSCMGVIYGTGPSRAGTSNGTAGCTLRRGRPGGLGCQYAQAAYGDMVFGTQDLAGGGNHRPFGIKDLFSLTSRGARAMACLSRRPLSPR